jgi:hypothetical protein
MNIINFSNYIKEAQIRTLDLVIDEQGNLYNNPPIKGNIDMANKLILGMDGKNYIAGIERTGRLFSFLPVDKMNNILLNDTKIKIPENLTEGRLFWNKSENYTRLIPLLPTGWVNVKIDMEVIKKIKRFSKSFSNRIGVDGLKDRLEALSRDVKLRARKSQTIQKELSAIMMLHHLNELKTHFDPSSSGFLFESYIAGLIPGSFVREDNSAIDVEDKRGDTYQIKLVDKVDGLPIKRAETKEYLTYYIVAVKYADKVRIFIFNGFNNNSDNYVENFKVRTGADIFSSSKFNKYTQENCDFVFDLYLINIQERIDSIAVGLKETLDVLYTNLSEFQYNVETILTGVDEEGNILDPSQFSNLENKSQQNVITMRTELRSLIDIMRN